MKNMAVILAAVSITLQLVALGIAVTPMDLFQGAWYDKSDTWNLEDWDYWGFEQPQDTFFPQLVSNVEPTSAELYIRAESSGSFRLSLSMRCNIGGEINDTYYRGSSEASYDGPSQKWVAVLLSLDWGKSPATFYACVLVADVDEVGGLPGPSAIGWGEDSGRHHFLKVFAQQYAEGGGGDGGNGNGSTGPTVVVPSPPQPSPDYEPPEPPAVMDWRIAAVLAVVGLVMLVFAIVLVKVV